LGGRCSRVASTHLEKFSVDVSSIRDNQADRNDAVGDRSIINQSYRCARQRYLGGYALLLSCDVSGDDRGGKGKGAQS
jgi:hypothetical protein